MPQRRLIIGWLVGGLVLVTSMGCGPGRGELSGKVTYGNKPLRMGSVVVLGSDGIPKSALIQENGSYTITEIAACCLKLSVTSPDPGRSQPSQRIPGTPQPKVDRTGWFAIPDKYGDFEKSGLTFDLKPGPNTRDLELK